MRKNRLAALVGILATAGWLAVAAPAGADGTETLGPPAIGTAPATGVAVSGTGLFVQPSTFMVTVPPDATIRQVLLYLEAGHRNGDRSGMEPDNSVMVNGVEVVTNRIGGPSAFYGDVITATHRADITALGLVAPGETQLTIDGLDTDEVDDGVGIVVLYDQPGQNAAVQVVDGNDIAFVDFAAPFDTTVPQTFTVQAADVSREATLSLLVSSLHDPVPFNGQTTPPVHRPHVLELTVAGQTTRLVDVIPDRGNAEIDWAQVPVTVPAGATTVTAQLLSERDGTGDLPASLVWLAASLAVPGQAPVTTIPPTIVPPTTVPPTTAPPTTSSTVPTGVQSAARSLAQTGRDNAGLIVLAIALAGGGTALAVGTRRRRTVR